MGRTVDPDVGVHADWTALGAGLALTAASLVAGTIALALAASSREAKHLQAQRSAIASWLGRVAPVPVGIGAQMALERGPGARSMPVRPTLAGAVIGVLGVVGALTINAGIRHALDNPQLAGVTWGATVAPPEDAVTSTSVSARNLADVERAAPGASVAVVRRDLVPVDGVGVPTFSVRDVGHGTPAVTFAMVTGRPPTARDEAAIGPATAKSLKAHVGDWVDIGDHQRVRLVGEALFPSDVHAEFDEGLWLTTSEFDRVVPPPLPAVPNEYVVVRFPDARNQENEAIAASEADPANNPIGTGPIGRLTANLGIPISAFNSSVEPVSVPLELTNLEDLSQLPIILGAFLAVLGLAALSYVLVISGRSRKAEFAVFKALGLDEKTTRRIVYFQASVIATVGLVVGIPLGIIVGRWGWSAVTTRVPLVDVPPLVSPGRGPGYPGRPRGEQRGRCAPGSKRGEGQVGGGAAIGVKPATWPRWLFHRNSLIWPPSGCRSLNSVRFLQYFDLDRAQNQSLHPERSSH